MSRKGRKYTGDLAKPYSLKPIGLMASDEQKDAREKEALSELGGRMGLLFDEYGVKRGDFESLCWLLAIEHVPGMSEANPVGRGRPQKWGTLERALLAVCIEERRSRGLSITAAASELAVEEPWASMVGSSGGGTALRNEYTRLDGDARRLTPMLGDVTRLLMGRGAGTE